jgi:hypothetical protein
MTQQTQSTDEVLRVADEFFRVFAKPNLVKDGKEGAVNAERIAGYCFQKYGVLTISGMQEATQELTQAGKLYLIPEPKVLTPAQIEVEQAKREQARMARDLADSRRPSATLVQNEWTKEKLAENKAAQNKKDHEKVLGALEAEISQHFVGVPSGHGINHSKSESDREILKGVSAKYDKRTIDGARNALQAVREAKQRL